MTALRYRIWAEAGRYLLARPHHSRPTRHSGLAGLVEALIADAADVTPQPAHVAAVARLIRAELALCTPEEMVAVDVEPDDVAAWREPAATQLTLFAGAAS